MTVCAVLASLVPILWESGIGPDVMKPIAAPFVGGMITSTIHVLILVPVFFVMMKERASRKGHLQPTDLREFEGGGGLTLLLRIARHFRRASIRECQ